MSPILTFLLALSACGDDAASDAGADAGRDAAVRDSGFDRDDAGLDAGSFDGGSADAGPTDPPFEPLGFPATVPFGPSFAGIQSDLQDGAPHDTALAVFWRDDAVVVDYADDTCLALRTLRDSARGRDVGVLAVSGGSGVADQALTFSDGAGVYYLDGALDPWIEGDAISIAAEGIEVGPAEIPPPFETASLTTIEEVVRGEALSIAITGATSAGISLAGSGIAQDYQILCVGPVAGGVFVVPAGATASVPLTVTELHAKLQPVTTTESDGVLLIGAGNSISTTLAVRDR
jgi:hypothetical protein